MRKRKFNDFLQEVHGSIHSTVLDDDLSDHYDNWLGEMDPEDYIKWADLFAQKSLSLSVIQFDAIMAAINNAKNDIEEDEFISPYAELPYPEYTNENLFEALNEVEEKLINYNTPT